MFHKTLKVLQHPIQNIYFLKATATAFRLLFPKCTRLSFTSLLEDYPPFYKSFFELCELVWFLSSSIKFSSKHRSLGHVCSRHAASVGFCAFVEVALSARLDTCMVPLEPPSSPNGRLQKCWFSSNIYNLSVEADLNKLNDNFPKLLVSLSLFS